MAEWFVDPANGLTTNNGTSANAPWKLIPGQTGASSQTGYSVTAGDTINVRNGTTSTLALALPANNLTYRGYGLASNKLTLTLPGQAGRKNVDTVVREAGVHEGMWVLDAGTAAPFGFLDFSNRSGCTVEDVHVIAPNASTTVSIGASNTTAIGATLRRARISGAAQTGIAAYTRSLLFEDVALNDIGDDGITIGASVNNSYRANTNDVLRRICIERVGTNEVSNLGDAIQTFAASDKFESSLQISSLYVNKPSNVKQAIVFTDVLGGFVLEDFLFESAETGHAQILCSGLGGNATIRSGYIRNGCADNAAIRISGTQGMEVGTTLTVTGVIVNAPKNAGFFTVGGSESASTIAGRIVISNCSISGVNEQNFTFSGGISVHAGAFVTLAATASLLAVNNVLEAPGQPAFRLPVGGANDSRWVIKNNQSQNSPWGAIGATSYTTLSDFQAAHSSATGNFNLNVPGYVDGQPVPATFANAGIYTQGVMLANGRLRPNNTPIGAYMAVQPRAVRA